MRYGRVIAGLIALIASTSTVSAQTQGTVEVEPFGSITHLDHITSQKWPDNLGAGGSVGYFVANRWEVALSGEGRTWNLPVDNLYAHLIYNIPFAKHGTFSVGAGVVRGLVHQQHTDTVPVLHPGSNPTPPNCSPILTGQANAEWIHCPYYTAAVEHSEPIGSEWGPSGIVSVRYGTWIGVKVSGLYNYFPDPQAQYIGRAGVSIEFGGHHAAKPNQDSLLAVWTAQDRTRLAIVVYRERCDSVRKALAQAQAALQAHLAQDSIDALVILDTPVHFDFDKSEIRTNDATLLDEKIVIFQKYPTINILITGNTDLHGSFAYNDRLGLRRAASVRAYLIAHGVDANRITVESHGKRNPVINSLDDNASRINRRDEFKVVVAE